MPNVRSFASMAAMSPSGRISASRRQARLNCRVEKGGRRERPDRS
jgi:hypothetical protein